MIGIDEWAWKRDQSYGTILCDLEKGRVLDLLPDREAGTVSAWLIRERTAAGLVEARRRGRKGGRPAAFTTADVVAARALMAEGKLPVRDVAKRRGVSVATLYRHLGKRGSAEPAGDGGSAHA